MAWRSTCAWTAAFVTMALSGTAVAADADAFRVRLPPSHRARYVGRALQGAHERLARPECQKLFTDYTDQAGRPLQERLDTLALSGQEFLTYIGFYEGHGQLRCGQERVLAFTQPGSMVVRVCPQITRQGGEHVEMIVLHEMLHSLGLGENPPSSLEITAQVRRRCGGRGEPVKVRIATR